MSCSSEKARGRRCLCWTSIKNILPSFQHFPRLIMKSISQSENTGSASSTWSLARESARYLWIPTLLFSSTFSAQRHSPHFHLWKNKPPNWTVFVLRSFCIFLSLHAVAWSSIVLSVCKQQLKGLLKRQANFRKAWSDFTKEWRAADVCPPPGGGVCFPLTTVWDPAAGPAAPRQGAEGPEGQC